VYQEERFRLDILLEYYLTFLLLASVAGVVAEISSGFGVSSGADFSIGKEGTDGNWESSTNALFIHESSGNSNVAEMTSLDSDGFTLTWTKTGSPTGTANIGYFAIG